MKTNPNDLNHSFLALLRTGIDRTGEERILALADLLKFHVRSERKLLEPLRSGEFPQKIDDGLRLMAGEVCSTTLHSWRGESPLVALYGSSLFLWCCRAEFGKCDDSGAAKACVILVEAALALPVNGLSMCIQFLEGMIEVETPNSACLYYSVLGFLICVSRFASVDPGFHLNEPSAQKLDRAIEHI